MKYAKKVLCVLVMCCIIIPLFTGCTQKANGNEATQSNEKTKEETKSKDPVKLEYWLWSNTNNGETDVVADFNSKNPDIVVELEEVGWDNFHEKLLTAVNAGSPPDVCPLTLQWLPNFIEMEAIIALDDYIKNWAEKDLIYKNLWDAAQITPGQPIYGIPKSNIPLYLYCRKDMFEEAGVKYPETLDEFYDACEKLTKDTDGDGKIDQYAFGLRGARGGHLMWAALVMPEVGGSFIDESGNPRFNTPEAVAANERYLQIYKKGYAPKTAPKDGWAEIIQNMESSITAMLVHHVNSSKQLVDKFGDNITAVPLPKGKYGRWVPIDPTVSVIFSECKNKDAAFKFNSWLSEPTQSIALSKKLGQVPVNSKAAEEPYFTENVFYKASMESMGEAMTFPSTPEMAQWVELTWANLMQRALLGEISSEEMMKGLEDAMKPAAR